MNEQNVMEFLIAGTMIAGFIGFVYGCYRISDNGEIEMKKKRQAVKRGITNFARRRAHLAVSSQVIRKG